MRGLFVTHDVSFYGAATSLRTLLSRYQGSCDLLVRERLLRRQDLRAIRQSFPGPGIRNVLEGPTPFDPCFTFKETHARALWGQALINAQWHAKRARFYELLRAKRYDFIHLNSLVLHPMITAEHPFILHVRDLYDFSNPGVLDSLQRARGVVFIDEATRAPFRELSLAREVVLNNPFDMSRVASFRDWAAHERELLGDAVVLAMIGRLHPNKGSRRVIEAFLEADPPSARLLLVGSGDERFVRECRTAAAGDRRVVFWGEDPEIARVYALADHVIRGEDRACIGRTIFEALYAGCGVIVPGTPEATQGFFEYERFASRVRFYPPGDQRSLARAISEATRIGDDRTLHSNVEAYVEAFSRFVQEAVGAP